MVFSVIIYLALMMGTPADNSKSSTTESIETSKCSITASVKVEKVEEGFLVKVKVEGDTDKMQYIFCNNKGNLVNDKSDSNIIIIQDKGNYFCVLSRNKDCFKKIEFEL